MKAVFIHRNSVLCDSHIDPSTPPDTWRLTPATLEAIRLLGDEETLVFLYNPLCGEEKGQKDGLETLVRQVEAAGGRVDALIFCEHEDDRPCKCWGDFPGAFWLAAAEFNLHLNECYVLGDTQQDVEMAYAVGARPMIILCTRTIGEIIGNLPKHKGFPLAGDLTTAANYITVEEDIRRQSGYPRNPTPMALPDALYADPDALPTITATSSVAQGVQARLRKSRVQLRDMGRWLTFFVLGALGLSLGIAYLLTHLYRSQPFPEYIYWITLQFIPRPLRGGLFILWGVGILVLAIRNFYRSSNLPFWRKQRS